ncbi:MAG: site-specific tyrosine recombinase/integron integrase [Promethearchaeota archaeon]
MGVLKLSTLIDNFLIAKEIEEGCTPLTIQAYRYDLKLFFELIGDLEDDSPAIRQKVRFFLKLLKDRNYTKKALARKIATLRSFFKFLTLNDYILANPMETIKSPKIRLEESLPKFLEISDIEVIFKNLSERGLKTKEDKIFYLIVRLLYSSMARVSELCNLRIKDVDFNHGYLKLRGKGHKERIVPVDQKTLVVIYNYLKERDIWEENDPLLLSIRDCPLTPRIVQFYVKKIKNKCNFPAHKKLTPHVFRHSGATHLRRSGMDISELQDILGHSSPNTTRIYAKNDITKLKESYTAMHPLNRIREK